MRASHFTRTAVSVESPPVPLLRDGAKGANEQYPGDLHADGALVRELVRRYPTIRYLIGHQEYLRFRGTPLWQELDDSYQTKKKDPGNEFMAEVRKAIADLNLQSTWSSKATDHLEQANAVVFPRDNRANLSCDAPLA